MKLRIVSDGTREGTKVLTTTGEQIEGVQLLSWSMSSSLPEDPLSPSSAPQSEATIHLWGVPCDVVAGVTSVIIDDVYDSPFEVDEEAENVIDISHLIKRLSPVGVQE